MYFFVNIIAQISTKSQKGGFFVSKKFQKAIWADNMRSIFPDYQERMIREIGQFAGTVSVARSEQELRHKLDNGDGDYDILIIHQSVSEVHGDPLDLTRRIRRSEIRKGKEPRIIAIIRSYEYSSFERISGIYLHPQGARLTETISKL